VQVLRQQLPWVLVLLTACTAGANAQSHLEDSNSDSTSNPEITGKQPQGSNSDRPSISEITGKQRLEWVVKGTVGPRSLATGIFTSAIQTAENRPREYGPHWDGFGKRYGIRLTGVATEHVMEASLGALWGEDPRYFRAEDHAFSGRMKHIIVMTVAARRPEGNLAPAYARLISMPASNFLSNTWRADSISNTKDAIGRTVLGFAGKLAGNAIAEFWPDLKKRIQHRKE
jgi:hypothetical protein